MTLVDRLSYSVPAPNRLQRLALWLAATKPGAWLFSKVLHHVDRALSSVSRGRWSLTRTVGGLPIVELVSTGARSGQPRISPLIGIPHEGTLAVIGSGWGQAPTPGWVYNLRSDPGARLRHDGREVHVVAREAAGPELQAIWDRARSMYTGFSVYPARASHRDIAVFLFDLRD